MNAIDALGLIQCPGLSQLVAWRNSSLGKQMQPSQLLHYEKQLVNELSNCIQSLAGVEQQQELQKQLEDILVEKQNTLPAVRWNAVFADTELTKQLRSNGRLLSGNSDNGQQGTLEVLNYLTIYLPDSALLSPYDNRNLELQLQQLLASHYSGQLIYSVIKLTETLNNISEMLSMANIICPDKAATIKAERLNNVFRLFYIDAIQPYLAQIVRDGQGWRQRMSQLLKQLPVPPSVQMQHFIDSIILEQGEDSIWEALNKAVDTHTKNWQRIFTECGLMPIKQHQG